jgi:Chaperone of endosialidase
LASAHIAGSPVYVSSDGQLGVLASSERYKTGVTSSSSTSEKLNRLRPVSYHLKNDPQSGVQYGLIAEEVDKVIPELVIRDDSGKIQGVRYDELAPMLVKEVQQQHAEIAALKQQASAVRWSRRADQRRVRLSSSHRHPLIFCIAGLDDIGADRRTAARPNLHRRALRRDPQCDMSLSVNRQSH